MACVTWVAYSIGIGLLASSFPWLHHNPLLSAGIAVVFAIVLGILIDHLLRWWHKRLARNDAEAESPAAEPAAADTTADSVALAGPSADTDSAGK